MLTALAFFERSFQARSEPQVQQTCLVVHLCLGDAFEFPLKPA